MLISAFIDNIPYVATMLPVITGIASSMGISPEQTMVLYLGLLSGATLGGNLTPIGASANITASRHPPIHEDQRALHFDSGVSRIRSCLGSLRLTALFGE